MPLRSGSWLVAAATLQVACVEVALDNPLRYADVPPGERIVVPCYYAIDPVTDTTSVEDFGNAGYRVKLGQALAGQLQAALGGLCRGTGRVRDLQEFVA